MVIFTTNVVPFEWQIPGYQWALIIPLSLVVGCHILLPVRLLRFCFPLCIIFDRDWKRWIADFFFSLQIVLNPWLMIFSF